MQNFAQHVLVLKREAALGGILAATLLMDVPGFFLAYRRLIRGTGASPLTAIPAMAYVWIGLASRVPLILGPVDSTLLLVLGKLLDVIALVSWHSLFVALGPRVLAKALRDSSPSEAQEPKSN